MSIVKFADNKNGEGRWKAELVNIVDNEGFCDNNWIGCVLDWIALGKLQADCSIRIGSRGIAGWWQCQACKMNFKLDWNVTQM